MIVQKIHDLLIGNRFYGIELLFTDNGEEFHIIEVEKKKTDLKIINEYFTDSFINLNDILDKKTPIIISFTGQNIITKKNQKEIDYRSKILFNANEEEFYWYELETKENIFVSVARKETINNQILLFKKNNFSVINYCLGPINASLLTPLMENRNQLIHTNTYSLFFDKNELISIEKEKGNSNYKIGNDLINSKNIVSFGTIVNHFFPNKDISYEIDLLKNDINEFKYQQAFKYVGIGSLGFFLISLLISFFTLNYYQNKEQKIQQELVLQSSAYNKVLSLEKDRKNKQAILVDSGLNDTHFISFYVNEIIKNIPEKINLNQLNVFPVSKKIKENQHIEFLSSQINITGTAEDNNTFSQWVKELKKLNWIKNIEITDFQKEKKHNSFIIKLTIN